MTRQPTEKRKQQIVWAALKIIAEQGLGKFTTSAIAKEVGLSDGGLFRHFKSKKEIVLAAITTIEEKLFQNFPPQRDDPLKRLGNLITQRLEFIAENPSLVRLILSDQLAQASGIEGTKLVRLMQTRTIDFIHSGLEEAKELGLIRDDLSVDELTVIILGMVFGAANYDLYKNNLSKSTTKDMSKRLWSTLETLIRR